MIINFKNFSIRFFFLHIRLNTVTRRCIRSFRATQCWRTWSRTSCTIQTTWKFATKWTTEIKGHIIAIRTLLQHCVPFHFCWNGLWWEKCTRQLWVWPPSHQFWSSSHYVSFNTTIIVIIINISFVTRKYLLQKPNKTCKCLNKKKWDKILRKMHATHQNTHILYMAAANSEYFDTMCKIYWIKFRA